jgi:short subunit dehydrogenase-like uncharacterized protein
MTVLIYGAYGYTGELLAREAVDRNIDVIVAGRNGTRTRGLGAELGVDSRVFGVDQAGKYLDGVATVLNCAGPFAHTHEPMVEACLETGTDYLDITGELPVFESIAERDRRAEQEGICLLPGVGFDVVPTDCLGVHLRDRLPDATQLRLGFEAPANVSGGTLASVLEHAGSGGNVREDGDIVTVQTGAEPRRIDFGRGTRHAVRVPWGDVSTAYYSTGIPNIEVYAAVPGPAPRILRILAPLTRLVGYEPIKRGLQALGRRIVGDPSPVAREHGRGFVWGEATDGERTITSRLVTPESYSLTVDAAVTAIEHVSQTDLTGYQTPASAFGPSFVLGLEDVEGFHDETLPTPAGEDRQP